jgi:hypothetical protein
MDLALNTSIETLLKMRRDEITAARSIALGLET